MALSLLAAGAIVNLAAGTGPKWSRWATYGTASVASALVALIGALCVTGHPLTVDLGNLLDVRPDHAPPRPVGRSVPDSGRGLGLGHFLVHAQLAGPYPAGARASGWAYMLLLAAVTIVVVAADAFTFLLRGKH